MNVFESVVQAAEASRTCGDAVKLFTGELEETGCMIQQRVLRQKEEAARRIVDLQQIADSAGATDTQRRMAVIELRQLETVTYGPTAAELEAFAEAKARAMDACRDFYAEREKFRESHKNAVTELSSIKEEILPERGFRDAYSSRIDRISDSFDRWTAQFT